MSHLAELSERAARRRAPLSALFELTGRCNLECGHCYLDLAHPPDELTTAEAMAVIDQLADAGTMFLVLSGGELFLRPDALAIAAHARRRGMALRLFTNATRITAELAREIAALHPLGVEVSLYGTHGAAHDGVAQRRRTLRRTLRGLVHLRRAGVKLALKAPLLQSVTGELERLADYADRLGAPIAFDPFVKPRNDGSREPLALRADTEALARAIAHPRSGVLKSPSLPSPPPAGEAPCAIGQRTTKIAPNGDVYPCPTWPEPIGNLRQQSFAELWAGGPLLDRLRAITWGSLTGACAGCGQAGYCHRCLAVSRLEHGDELGPSDESCRIAEAKERALGLPLTRPSRGKVRLRVL